MDKSGASLLQVIVVYVVGMVITALCVYLGMRLSVYASIVLNWMERNTDALILAFVLAYGGFASLLLANKFWWRKPGNEADGTNVLE